MNQCICPVCRSSIKELPKAGLSFKAHFQLILITGVLAGLVYLSIGIWGAAKAILAYLPLWTLAEWVQWLKIREAARCQVCDFDPLLYHRDWKAARRRVEIRMQQLSEELQQRIQREIVRIQDVRLASNAQRSNASQKSPEKSH